MPAEFVAKEKEIELAKMSDKDKAKPAEILEKIICGKIAKIVNEVTLYGQPYVLDTDQTVEQVLKAAGAEVVGFQRLAVGEGIEKVVEDYAAEVHEGDAGLIVRFHSKLAKKPRETAAFLLSVGRHALAMRAAASCRDSAQTRPAGRHCHCPAGSTTSSYGCTTTQPSPANFSWTLSPEPRPNSVPREMSVTISGAQAARPGDGRIRIGEHRLVWASPRSVSGS